MIFHFSYPQNNILLSWDIQVQTWKICIEIPGLMQDWSRPSKELLAGAIWWMGHFRQKYFSFQDKMLWETFLLFVCIFFLIPFRQQWPFHRKGTPLVIFEKIRLQIFINLFKLGLCFPHPFLHFTPALLGYGWATWSVIIHFWGGFLLIVFKLEKGKGIEIFSCYSINVNSAAEIQMRVRFVFPCEICKIYRQKVFVHV